MTQPEPATSLLEPDFLRMLERLTLQLQGRIRGTRQGERRSTRRGTGVEFEDHRAYAVGDDLRHLDWHLMARLDALFVRLFQEPQEHEIHLVLDASASMGCGKGRFAQQLAGALAYVALCAGDRVGIYALRDRLDGVVGPLRGKQAAPRALDFLERVAFAGETDLERAVREVAATAKRGTVVLISDFLTPAGRVEALRTLAARRLRVIVLHTLAPEERSPRLGEEVTLIDAESGEELTLTIDKASLAAYHAQLNLLTAELAQACKGYGFTFIPVTSSTPVAELILGDLRRAGAVATLH